MTAIMGLLCSDGIILTSDSLGESGIDSSVNVSKIFNVNDKCFFAFSGNFAHIEKVINILNKKVLNKKRNLSKIISLIEEELLEFYKKYKEAFDLLIGLFIDNKFELMELSCNRSEEIMPSITKYGKEFWAEGCGSAFHALRILEALSYYNLNTIQPNIDKGLKISTFVMDNCIRIDSRSGIGYPVQITKMFLKNKKVVIEKLDKNEIDNLLKEMRDKTSKLFN